MPKLGCDEIGVAKVVPIAVRSQPVSPPAPSPWPIATETGPPIVANVAAAGGAAKEAAVGLRADRKPCEGPQQSHLKSGEMANHLEKYWLGVGDQSPLLRIAVALERIADHLAPEPENIVGTGYVARKLGYTPTHVARLARDGDIPSSCVVPGCGDGRPWKFMRLRIDNWLETR